MEQNIRTIHEASMQILEEVGVKIYHPEVLNLIKHKGVKVVGQTVFFTYKQIMEWIKKATEVFTVYARNPKYNIKFGGEQTEYAAGYGAPVIIDEKGNKRPAVLSDYINFLKLVHQCDYFKINGGILVQPSDLCAKESFPVMLYASLIYTDKCLIGGAGGAEETQAIIDMLSIVFGDQRALINEPRIMTIVNSTSPLQFDKDTLDTMLIYARYGQPMIVSAAVMAGTTGPVTIAGTIALSNAEILAGITIAQMIREGTPVMYGMQSTAADMKTGGIADGSPERALCVAYGARLARAYGLPCRGGGTENDAKSLSVQSGYESMMDMLVACQEKVNLIIHSAGTLDSHFAMSYEKFIVDMEIIGMVRRFVRGIDLNEESLAVNVIKEVGSGGEFLTSEHTMKYCRQELFIPTVSLRGPLYPGENPEEKILANIRKQKEDMLAAYYKPELDPVVQSRLIDYLETKGFNQKLLADLN